MEEPLLPLSTPIEGGAASAAIQSRSSPSVSAGNILTRLTFLVLLASITVWANHEASKGFQITILNDARGSDAGKRFDLLFVSNDRATKLVLDASSAIEQLLYPDLAAYPKKPVQHVALRLARHNLSSSSAVTVSRVDEGRAGGEFVIQVSPSVVSGPAASARMAAAVYRGMVQVWLSDGQAPSVFLDAVEEHLLSVLAGFPPAENRQLRNLPNGSGAHRIGEFLRFCDGRTRDFIPRLNRAMRLRSVRNSSMEQLVASGSVLETKGGIESSRLCESLLESTGPAADGGIGVVDAAAEVPRLQL